MLQSPTYSFMRAPWFGSICLVIWCFAAVAAADSDYYEAFSVADSALQSGHCDEAAHSLEHALGKYPRDYGLTLQLAWVEFQCEHFERAEQLFREAAGISEGALEARLGVAWSLVGAQRCEQAVPLLQQLLAEDARLDAARSGMLRCETRDDVHGAVWASIGGSLYRNDPWKDVSGSAMLGLRLRVPQHLQLGAVYRFLALRALDPRVAGFVQHEIYAQAGYVDESIEALAHGALIWSGDVVGGSRHAGASLRVRYGGSVPGDVFVEASGSYYRDLWAFRLAPSWTLIAGPWSLTLEAAAQRVAQLWLGAGSASVTLTSDKFIFSLGGKVGPEYRAAYLNQFAVFNAADRSLGSVSAGAQLRIDASWSLFVSYMWVRLRSGDGLSSTLHNLSVGSALSF